MLKLRVVLSFAVAALVALTSLDGVTAQQVDPPLQEGDEPSYSGSGGTYDAGTPDASPTTSPTPVPTKDTSSSSKGTNEISAGDGVVHRWGSCGPEDTCVSGTYCKKLGNGMSLCYPG